MGAALSLIVSVGVPLGGGFASGLITRDEVNNWYKGLKKPKWNPPNWLFGPAWSVLYTSMGVASWLVWRSGDKKVTPLTLYGVQLALNLIWTPLFFKAHKPDLALVDSTAILGIATAATVTMAQSAGPAKILPLMIPYLAWTTFASALTFEILRENPELRPDFSKLKRKGKKASKKTQDSTKAAADKVSSTSKEAADKVSSTSKEAAGKVSSTSKEAADKVSSTSKDTAKGVSSAVQGAATNVQKTSTSAAAAPTPAASEPKPATAYGST